MSEQLPSKTRKTTKIADGVSLMEINKMTDNDFESVLEEVTNHKSNKSSKTLSNTPHKDLVSKLFEEKDQEIRQEEDKFGGSLIHLIAPKRSHGLSYSATKSTSHLAVSTDRNQENECKFEPSHQHARPQIQQSLGSAGSSKASSNASDESEEMDASGMNSNFDPLSDYGGDQTSVYQNEENESFGVHHTESDYARNFQRNYHHDMQEKEQVERKETDNHGGGRINTLTKVRNHPEHLKIINRGYEEDYREQRQLQGSSRVMFAQTPDPRNSSNRGGLQSDPQHYQQIGGPFPQHENENYLKKKEGRKLKLEKLSKYQSKKQCVLSSSLDNKDQQDAYEKVLSEALKKNGALQGVALLDYLNTEKMKLEKTEPAKKLLHSTSAPAETSLGKTNKKTSPEVSSKSYSSMSKIGRARGEGNSKVRKAKVSDSESSHGSDQEMAADNTLRSTRLAAFPKHSKTVSVHERSSNLDAASEVPVSYSITQQSAWEDDIEVMERDNLRYCSPSAGEHVFSSGRSSHSSEDRGELEVGRYVRLEEADVDPDDTEKPKTTTIGKVEKQKKKKKKSKKKKASPEQSKELPKKEQSASPENVVPSSPLNSIRNEELPSPRPKTPVTVSQPEQSQSNEQLSETDFQVVTRRVSAKTSPTKSHSTPHNYPAPNRQPNVRNRMSQQAPRISKQPAVAVVPVISLEFPTMRRRNSAGDIKKGLADPVPDTDAGNISEVESVHSMPTSKKSSKKTTSAPATRLPTPGVSYADIAKGTQNGGSHNNSVSDTGVVESSPERSPKTMPENEQNDLLKKNYTESLDIVGRCEMQTGPLPVPSVAPVVCPAENEIKSKDGQAVNIRPNNMDMKPQQFRPRGFNEFNRGHSGGFYPVMHNGPPPPSMHQYSMPRNTVARQFNNHSRQMAPQNFNQRSPSLHQGINLPPPRFTQALPFHYSQGHSGPAQFLGTPVMHHNRGVSPPAQPFVDPRMGQPAYPLVFPMVTRPELGRNYPVPPGYAGEMWSNGPPLPVLHGAVRLSMEPPPSGSYAYVPNGLAYGSVQSFYPDIGCSHNVSTYTTHMELMRRMKPAAPLAQLPGPGIYPRSRVNLPPPSPPAAAAPAAVPEENANWSTTNEDQWIGKKSVIFRNGQEPIYDEQDPVSPKQMMPEVKNDNLGKGLYGEAQTANTVKEEETPRVILRTAADMHAFMKERFEAARQKCLAGAPGCRFYRT